MTLHDEKWISIAIHTREIEQLTKELNKEKARVADLRISLLAADNSQHEFRETAKQQRSLDLARSAAFDLLDFDALAASIEHTRQRIAEDERDALRAALGTVKCCQCGYLFSDAAPWETGQSLAQCAICAPYRAALAATKGGG